MLILRISVALVVLILAHPSFAIAQESSELTIGTRALYRGEYRMASQSAAEYLKAHPDNASALILLGRAEVALGEFQPAFAAFEKAQQLEPANLDALYYLEKLCTILSQKELRHLLETSPDSFRSHQVMAESYLSRNDRSGAEKEYQAALQVNPNAVDVLDALGDLMRSEFKFDAALDYYARARKFSPHDYGSAYGAGACYLFQNNPQQAAKYLQGAVASDPDSTAAHLALGDAWLRAGQASAAIRELEHAVRLSPRSRQGYGLLARAYRKQGMAREAQNAYTREHELTSEEEQGAESGLGEETQTSAPRK